MAAHGAGLILRVATVDDGPGLADIYGPIVRDSAISFETDPPDGAEMARRVAATLPTYPWLIADDDGMVAGYAYGHRFAERTAYGWAVETSIYVHADRRGRGIGRALYGSLLPILGWQGYRRAIAGATIPNPASEAIHAVAGFRRIGMYERIGWKRGAWHDVAWWQLDLGGDDAPAAPIAFADVPRDVLARWLSG
jgi:L-amino acid N-acyltransferase YncA